MVHTYMNFPSFKYAQLPSQLVYWLQKKAAALQQWYLVKRVSKESRQPVMMAGVPLLGQGAVVTWQATKTSCCGYT